MPIPASVSLTLAPHSRLRMDLRLGRVGSLNQALADDPELFSRPMKTEMGTRRVGDFLLFEAILSCSSPSNQALVSYLMAKRASSPDSFPGALSYAMSSNDMDIVRLLEKEGWTPDIYDPGGRTALAQASYQALADVVKKWQKFLPLPPAENGYNLLHELCSAGLWTGGENDVVSTAEILIKAGTDWNLATPEGQTPGDLCKYPVIVDRIDAIWQKHWATQKRKALGEVSAKVRTPPTNTSSRSALPRM